MIQLLALQRVQQLLSTGPSWNIRPPQDTKPPQHQDARPPQQHQDTRLPLSLDTRPHRPQEQDTRPPQQQDTRPPEPQHTVAPQRQEAGSDPSTSLLRNGANKASQPILNGWTQSSSPSPVSVKGRLIGFAHWMTLFQHFVTNWKHCWNSCIVVPISLQCCPDGVPVSIIPLATINHHKHCISSQKLETDPLRVLT